MPMTPKQKREFFDSPAWGVWEEFDLLIQRRDDLILTNYGPDDRAAYRGHLIALLCEHPGFFSFGVRWDSPPPTWLLRKWKREERAQEGNPLLYPGS